MNQSNIDPLLKGKRKEDIRLMFNNIAFKYDFLNDWMSFRLDRVWRKKALKKLLPFKPQIILDVATGTADFAIKAVQFLSPEKVIGIDIAEGMIEIGKLKVKNLNLDHVITLQVGDSEQIEFEDNTFDAVTVSFGVRNFEHLMNGLFEIKRVLKNNGKLVILEFSLPEKFPFKQLYSLYFNFYVPVIGNFFTRHNLAYAYLPGSVSEFPYGQDFVDILKNVGFTDIEFKPLTTGICTIYFATKY